MNMSHKGRALSISEKQMVVHVKHYFDKEKELFLTNKKLDVNNSAFRTALATNLSQVTVWRIMAEYNSNDSFSPPVKKGSRTYAINENVKTICQDIIRSHNICRKHLSLRLLVGILHDEHDIVVARVRRPNRHFAGDQLLGSECRCCLFDARWPCIFNG